MNKGVIGKGKVVVIGSSDTRIEINELQSTNTKGLVLVVSTCLLCLLYTVLMVEAHTKK
ncbi:MAG: hypothetical protein QM758_17250 [Armatimonas sp.]